jgi:hypothetical protein
MVFLILVIYSRYFDHKITHKQYNYYCTVILKVWDIFFSRAKHKMGHFLGFFKGAETFLTLNCPEHSEGQFWGQKGQDPLEKPQAMPHYMFCPKQKKLFPVLSKSEVHWYFYVPKRERKSKSKSESKSESESKSKNESRKGKGKEKGAGKGTRKGKAEERKREKVRKRWRFYF